MQAEDVFKNDNLEDFVRLVKDRWEQNFNNEIASNDKSTASVHNTNNTNVQIDQSDATETDNVNCEKTTERLTAVKPEEFDPNSTKLDERIQFAALETRAKEPKTALLTGVTGILGVFILSELMEQTQLTVYCLVRDRKYFHIW